MGSREAAPGSCGHRRVCRRSEDSVFYRNTAACGAVLGGCRQLREDLGSSGTKEQPGRYNLDKHAEVRTSLTLRICLTLSTDRNHSLRRNAHDLVTLTSSTRRSGTEPTSTQVTSLNELDYLDVFDFFNYPKLAPPKTSASADSQSNLLPTQALGDEATRNTGMPNSESDWLGLACSFS